MNSEKNVPASPRSGRTELAGVNPSFKKRWWLLFWTLASWLGLLLGVLTMFLLYSRLELNRYGQGEDWSYLFRGLMLCGATQGLVLGILQGIVLWAMGFVSFQKMLHWLRATVVAMAIGMAFPIATASIDRDRLIGWMLSWLMAGLLLGAMTGHRKLQKIRFALINAVAYLLWGLAAVLGGLMLGAALDHVSATPTSWIGYGLLIILMLGAGSLLNSWVLLRSMMSRASLWLTD